MTEQEAHRRCLEIDLSRADLLREQALRRYRRMCDANSMVHGAIAEEEIDDARVTLELRTLDVEECRVKLGVE